MSILDFFKNIFTKDSGKIVDIRTNSYRRNIDVTRKLQRNMDLINKQNKKSK